MNKKAFTLVELIAVIVILSIILLITVPTLINNINDKKGTASSKVYDLLETAAKNYEIDYDIKEITSIPIETLCGRYISCPIIDPNTNEEIVGYITIGRDEIELLDDVSFSVDFNGGTSTQTFQSSYAPYSKIVMEEPTRNNYHFSRWEMIKGNGNINGNEITLGNRDMRVYAIWTTFPTLTVINEGESSQVFDTQYESGTIINLETPVRNGYNFSGWKVTEGNSVVSGNTFTMGTQNTTLEATWTIKSYNITYILDGGSNGQNAPTSINHGTTVKLVNPSRGGFTFTGWTLTGNDAVLEDNNLTAGTSDIVLTANWETPFVEYIEYLYNDSNLRIDNLLDKDDTDDENIRYVGSNTKNYVTYNGELWRVIGIFEVSNGTRTEKRIKLIRDEILLNASWDSSAVADNEGKGINEWSKADLKVLLNDYYAGSSTICTYCNDLGYSVCPNSCTSTVKKLSSEALSMIDNVVWNTGGIVFDDIDAEHSPTSAYSHERGLLTGRNNCSGNSCTDTVARTTEWTGKVGLIYPSDFGFASISSSCSIDITYTDACEINNWLYTGEAYWTLTPRSSTYYANAVWYVGDASIVDTTAKYDKGVRPSVYLKGDIVLTGGNGTSNNSYRIKIK